MEPIQLYIACIRFTKASAQLSPDTVHQVAEEQTRRIEQEMGTMECDHEQATALLEKLGETDPTNPFSLEQKQRIARVCKSLLDGSNLAPLASPATRSVNTEQQCDTIFDYMPQLLWDVIMSEEPMKNKVNHFVHFSLESLQLRNASATTRRIMAAILCSAMKLPTDPGSGYDMYEEITEAFKRKRDEIKSPQSMKIFPTNPTDFMRRFPDSFPDNAPPVKCPIDKKDITSRATKHVIPCRASNAKLKKQRPSPQASLDTRQSFQLAVPQQLVDPNMQAMQMAACLMQYMRADGNQPPDMLNSLRLFNRPSSPSGNQHDDRSQGLATEHVETPPTTSLIGRKNTLSGCLPSLKSKSQGNLDLLRSKIDHDLLNAQPDDEPDTDAEEPADAGTKIAKKPAGAVLKRPARKATSTDGRRARDVKLPKTASARQVLAAKKSIHPFPVAMKFLQRMKAKKNRPSTPANAMKAKIATYMTGRILPYPKKGNMRVFCRKGDRHEQKLNFDPKNKKEFAETWALACATIETDPRPVGDDDK
jgi:hypothetical protein